MNLYYNSIKLFEDFRSQYNLDKKWHVLLAHLVNFIVHLAIQSYSPSTARTKFVWNRI